MHGNGKSNGKRTVGVGVSPSSRTGKWGDAEKERGLVAVALCSGNTWRAAREIAAQGLPIPRSTLELWVRKNPELYRRVRDEKLDEIKATLAAQHEALARRQLEVSNKLTERLDKESDKLPIRDVSTAQRNLDVGTGIHTQRAAELRGDPKITVEVDFEQIMSSLKKYDLVVESDACNTGLHRWKTHG